MAGRPQTRARKAVAAAALAGVDADVVDLARRDGVTASAVRSAIKQMTWLKPSDAGLTELAVQYAQILDATRDPDNVAKIGARLESALRSLGGAPAERVALDTGQVVRGRLAELRAARDRGSKAVDSAAS